MRQGLIGLLGIVASLIALALIANGFRSLVDVLQLADPTGALGAYFSLGSLAANLAVIFMTLAVLFAPADGLRLGIAVVAFVPLVLEAAAALPCFLSAHPGALCGVGAVLVGNLGIPVVLAAFVLFVATARLRAVRLAGVAAALTFVAVIAAAHVALAPTEWEQCRQLGRVTKRSNCLKVFALRANDAGLCRAIEFRTTRFLCLHEIAVATEQAQLCEEIADTAPLQPYEPPPGLFRNTCFQNMAYALHDRGLCGRIEDPPLRANCEQGIR
jgi:hypothetical protein